VPVLPHHSPRVRQTSLNDCSATMADRNTRLGRQLSEHVAAVGGYSVCVVVGGHPVEGLPACVGSAITRRSMTPAPVAPPMSNRRRRRPWRSQGHSPILDRHRASVPPTLLHPLKRRRCLWEVRGIEIQRRYRRCALEGHQLTAREPSTRAYLTRSAAPEEDRRWPHPPPVFRPNPIGPCRRR
jgi:hypothetical protein